MLLRRRSTDALRRGDKVVAVTQIGGVPEGTRGVIKVVDGLTTWIRYWVAWETGEWTGSVDGSAIVRADLLEEYKRRQAEQAAAPKAGALTTGNGDAQAATAATATTAEKGTRGVPEHLLERSRQARARKAAQAEAG